MASIDKIWLKGVEYELSGSLRNGLEQAFEFIDVLDEDKQNKLSGDYVKDVEIGGGYITFNSMKFDGNNNGVKTANFKTINNQAIIGTGNLNVIENCGGSKISCIMALTSSEYKTVIDKGGVSSSTLYIIKD